MTLSEYLRQRGLDLNPLEIEQGLDPVMQDDALVKEAGDLWQSKENLIKMILQARINTISKYILERAVPEETIVYRQALVEIGALVNDFEKYRAEAERRKNSTDKAETPQEEPQSDPPEGKEGAL